MKSPRRCFPRLQSAVLTAVVCAGSAMLLSSCHDDAQSPPARPEMPAQEGGGGGGSMLAPLDLVYVCGNKFLATNSTRTTVELEYRVVGTDETGSITLRPGLDEDQGWSETELETRKRGVVELYQDDQRVARRSNEATPCGAAPFSASIASLGEAESGSWSAPFPWPIVALHLHLLPNGKVLGWGHSGDPQVWDPATRAFTAVPSIPELFCSGHSFLPDGRLLVAGGHISDDHGLPDITIYTPGLQTWSSSTPMRRGRWYPTNTTLGSGDVVILAGRDEAGLVVGEPEVWSPSGVRVLSSASLAFPYYPRAFLAPNGAIFYAGEQQTTRYLNPSGTGIWTTVGNRLYSTRDYGSAVMYDDGKILYAGGGRTTNTAEIIDLNSGAPTWHWTGSMAFPRRHLNLTALPTGEVLATGGSSGTGFNDVNLAVHAAEIWNPSTGLWTTLASNTINRTYHATSILLPDGRVLHSGSGDGGAAPNERSAELFSPPYLFKGPRPTITDAPSLVGYDIPFRVETPQAATIAKVSLIRLGSVTHAFDQNQRFQWLSFTRDAGGLTIAAPSSRNRTPPGHYMLFILDSNGVPSVAKIVKVGTEGTPAPPPNASPAANFSFTCTDLSCTFSDSSTDGDGTVTGWSWAFGDNGSSTIRNPSHTYASPGTYTVTLTVTDDDGATGQHSVSATVPPTNAAPSALFTTSCTELTCSFTDGSTDSDGSITEWRWDFGDESASTSQSPSHSYAAPGSYSVTLTVTDDDGATNDHSIPVTVPPPPPENTPPTAAFTASCNELSCAFTDGSGDVDGSVAAWEWDFGDGSTSTQQSPSHNYAAGGTYTVKLKVTDDLGSTGTTSKQIATALNAPPAANFSSSCTGLTCSFTDGSTDGDGTVTVWSWTFGDGSTSGVRNPSRTYGAAGTYTVTLKVTDDDGATAERSATVTVTAPSAIALKVTGRQDATTQYMTLTWTGASGTMVDVYRNGALIKVTENDGIYTNSRPFTGAITYTYKLCQSGTTICSNQASVSFGGGTTNAPPTANFVSSCPSLTCSFTDTSTDSDGTVTVWSWTFGDGSTSTLRNPSRTYAAAGTYTVTLKVTDNGGATNQRSASVSPRTTSSSIVLSVTGSTSGGTQYMRLTWTGASGAMVDVYRNGVLIKTTENDGIYTNARAFTGAATYTYKVCQAGTSVCSNQATVVFK